MLGVSGDQIEGVDQHGCKSREALRNPPRRSREIHEQAPSPDTADTPGQGSEGRSVEAPQSDQFGEARRLPVDHTSRGLGRHISRSKSGAPGGDHQIGARGGENQKFGDPVRVIGDDEGSVGGNPKGGKAPQSLGAGHVRPGSRVGGIADGDDHGGFGFQGFSTPMIEDSV